MLNAALTTLMLMLQSAPEVAATAPQFPQAVLQIPWTDFQAILNRVESAEKQVENEEQKAKPPVEWSIAEARYMAEVLDTNSVHVQADLTLHVWSDSSWVRIPVLGTSAAPTSVTLDGKSIGLIQGDSEYYELLLQEPGEHRLALEFFAPAKASEGVVSMSFPCAESALTRMQLTLPVNTSKVESPSATHIGLAPTEGGSTADLVFCRTKNIDVSWTLPVSAEPVATKVAPRMSCATWTLATVGDSYVTCKSRTQFTMLSGDADGFEFTAPANVTIHEVTGDGAEWSQAAGDNESSIQVRVNHAIQGTYYIDMSYELPYSGDRANVPMVRPAGALRETGTVAIAADGNLEVQPIPENQGVLRIDPSEIPPELLTQSALPLLLAFRHGEGGGSLALNVRRLRDVAVPESAIDRATLTTVISDDGLAVTRATYDVRNSVRQFLRISVGKNAEVWSARVAGQMVKPAQDVASDAVLIPLNRSAAAGHLLATFPVEIVYKTPAPRFDGLRADLDLNAPSTDLLCSAAQWEIYIPESRSVIFSEGDYSSTVSHTPIEVPASLRSGVGTQREIIPHLREEISRVLIEDTSHKPKPTGRARYTGEPLPADAVGPGPGRVAGVLSVPISLPMSGRTYLFGRGITPAQTPTTLHIETCPSWAIRWAAGGLRLSYRVTAVLIGLVLAHVLPIWLGLRKRHKWPYIALAILVGCYFGLRATTLLDTDSFWIWVLLGAAIPVARHVVEFAPHHTRVLSRVQPASHEQGA